MPDVDDLDASAVADALADVGAKVVAAEAEQFRLAAHWADLHAPVLVGEVTEELVHLRGGERVRLAGADGTPEIMEFAAAELGALLGRSTRGGEQLIADAANVRFRHPLLWAAIGRGEARVWLAAKVARRCAATKLNVDQAHWVDTQTTPYISTLPTGRFLELVEAKIIEADPDEAAARARAQAVERFVRTSPTDDHGLRTLVARARAGDVLHLVAVLDRLADILAEDGAEGTQQERRAMALRIISNPARALEMLGPIRVRLQERGDAEAPAGDLCPEEPVLPWDTQLGPGRTTDLPRRERRPGPHPPTHRRGAPRRSATPAGPISHPCGSRSSGSTPAGSTRSRSSTCTSTATPSTRRTAWSASSDSARCAPASSRPGSGEAFTASPIQVRPVLDSRDCAPVDRYEIPRRQREILIGRHPHEVFPYGTLPVRRCDFDHVQPYDDDGPPGQTSLDALAPLSRTHHRMKTHGGWVLRNPSPGEYWWRSPHGHWFSVNAHGTRHHGRGGGPDTEQPARLVA